MRPPAPVEEADVASLSQDGRGVARLDGKTVFVDGALAGERVRLRRTKRHRSYDEAVTVEVLSASPLRVAPACAHHGLCGGCRLQHLDPAAQLEVQQAQVAEEFERIGKVSPERWLAPLTGPSWGYRRRARLGLRYVTKRGRVLCGFRERAAPFLADVQRCEVLAEPIGPLVGAIGEMVGRLSIRERVPQAEVAVADHVAALVFRVLEEPGQADREVFAEFGRAQGIEIYLQPRGLDSVEPLTPPATPLTYALPEFDVVIEFAPTDFVQVNAVLNQRMVTQAVTLLDPQPGERVLDLFCGLGNFSLPLARRAAYVTGIEGDASLVARARANARRNGLDNVDFEVANLADPAAPATWRSRPHELVLLDPPRAGAWEALPAVAAMQPRRIVYVSCHPASLARDAGRLVEEHGFRMTAAGVMDMFPHTGHVETVAVFEAA